MKKKVVPVVASVLGASLLLTACGGNKDHANGAKANDKQAINLSFASEIPTMDVAKSTDGESMNVMRNVFEG
nr:peptide ABC transporter substrate-binding protein [Streptococcus oralis]